jgi:general secretion pathway protein A
MFLSYYNMAEQPFGVTADLRFLYLSAKHREALASLVYGTETDRGFLALIGEPGLGKTSLLYHYLDYLRQKARTAYVFRTDCDARELLRQILIDYGVDTAGMDLPAMHDALNGILLEEMNADRRVCLVIDEAQNLDQKALESIRMFSNFETAKRKLMLVVLAGQPQLAQKLSSPSLLQLRQRISMVIPVTPLAPAEVDEYIDHRLAVAGCRNTSLFTVDARKLIAVHSGGVPRNINNLCFHALSLGCALQRQEVGRDIVNEVIAELDLTRFDTPKESETNLNPDHSWIRNKTESFSKMKIVPSEDGTSRPESHPVPSVFSESAERLSKNSAPPPGIPRARSVPGRSIARAAVASALFLLFAASAGTSSQTAPELMGQGSAVGQTSATLEPKASIGTTAVFNEALSRNELVRSEYGSVDLVSREPAYSLTPAQIGVPHLMSLERSGAFDSMLAEPKFGVPTQMAENRPQAAVAKGNIQPAERGGLHEQELRTDATGDK